MDRTNLLKKIPSVNLILEKFEVYYPNIFKPYRNLVKSETIKVLSSFREKINSKQITFLPEIEDILSLIKSNIESIINLNHKSIINATGIVVNTNLGRSIISKNIANDLVDLITSYSNLEYNLDTGTRGSRYTHIDSLLSLLTGAESGFAVNNNASSLLLVCSEFAKGKEVIVSRGELIEIGDSFRLPDIIELSGAKLVEVGTTNRTYIQDYEKAINSNTGLILKSHWSNYQIQGFTKSVSSKELSSLGKKYNIVTFEDLGSGLIYENSNNSFFNLEPNIKEKVKSGIDILSFSGDKLLGASQAGIILGKKDIISRLKKNQLTRALRIDKVNLSILELTLKEYLKESDFIKEQIPTIKMITSSYESIYNTTKKVSDFLESKKLDAEINIIDSDSFAGGGSLPEEKIITPVLQIKPFNISVNTFAKILRVEHPHIIGRIEKNCFILNFRTVVDDQVNIVIKKVIEVLKKSGN